MLTRPGRAANPNACWYDWIVASATSEGFPARSTNPERWDRSSPAENDEPAPRRINTRTVPGNALTVRVSQNQVSGVCALCFSGRFSVIVAT
jgi:hypothetical protein